MTHLEDAVLHVHRGDAALEVGLHLVLVAGVGVHDVPVSRAGRRGSRPGATSTSSSSAASSTSRGRPRTVLGIGSAAVGVELGRRLPRRRTRRDAAARRVGASASGGRPRSRGVGGRTRRGRSRSEPCRSWSHSKRNSTDLAKARSSTKMRAVRISEGEENDDRVVDDLGPRGPGHLPELAPNLAEVLGGDRRAPWADGPSGRRRASRRGRRPVGRRAGPALHHPLRLSVQQLPLGTWRSERSRAGGTRTPNRRFWRPVLCQLSYCPWGRPGAGWSDDSYGPRPAPTGGEVRTTVPGASAR